MASIAFYCYYIAITLHDIITCNMQPKSSHSDAIFRSGGTPQPGKERTPGLRKNYVSTLENKKATSRQDRNLKLQFFRLTLLILGYQLGVSLA